MRRAQHRAGLGDLRDARLGDAEVGHGRLALGVDDHVLRLQVTVDDAVAVSEARPLEHLADQPGSLLGSNAGVDHLLQRAAFEVLHRDVVGTFELAAIEDGDDVGVLKARGGLGLAAEALDELLVLGEARVQDLECNPPLQVTVVGEPDVGHATRADALKDRVAAIDHGPFCHLSHASRLSPSFVYSPLRIVSATSRKIGAATSLPNSSVHSTVAAIAILGSFAGAKPMNQA